MSMNRIIYFTVVLYVFIVILFHLGRSVKTVPFNSDEISWFFHTKFFETLFIRRDITSPEWASQAGYDHPHVMKYAFGFYLYLRDRNVFTQRDALEHSYGRWDFYTDPRLTSPSYRDFAPYLYRMRELNVLFTIGVLMCLFFIGLRVGTAWYGALGTTIALSLNPLFVHSMLRVTPDAGFIFFGMVSILFLISKKGASSPYGWALTGLAIGLSASSKLAGGIFYIMYVMWEVCSFASGAQKRSALRLFTVTTMLVTVWYCTNPTVYFSPLSQTREYLLFRINESIQLQHSIPAVALRTIRDKVLFVYCEIFSPSCNRFHGVLMPSTVLNLCLWVIGLFVLAARCFTSGRNTSVVCIFVVMASILQTLVMPLYSDRYLLLHLISVYLAQMAAITTLIRVLWERFETQMKRSKSLMK